MAKDDSRTILLVLLIGGVLYMIIKTDEKDEKDTKEKQIEAVVKKKVDSWKEATELIKSNKDQQDQGWWMKLFAQCQRGIPFTYRNIQQLEHERVSSLPRDIWVVVAKWVAAIRYLIATMDEFFPSSSLTVQAKQIRKQAQELFQQVEYMRVYNDRNQRRRPVNRDRPGPPGAHKPSSAEDNKKKDSNQDIRDKFAANK